MSRIDQTSLSRERNRFSCSSEKLSIARSTVLVKHRYGLNGLSTQEKFFEIALADLQIHSPVNCCAGRAQIISNNNFVLSGDGIDVTIDRVPSAIVR